MIGSGLNGNSATDNGLERAAWLLDMEVPEVKNRATVTGAIEIGRHPGVVHVTLRAPVDRLEARGCSATRASCTRDRLARHDTDLRAGHRDRARDAARAQVLRPRHLAPGVRARPLGR